MTKEELLAEKANIEAKLANEVEFTDIGDDQADNAFEVEDYQNKLALKQTLEKRLAEIKQQLSEN